jgi:hypothetical protein
MAPTPTLRYHSQLLFFVLQPLPEVLAVVDVAAGGTAIKRRSLALMSTTLCSLICALPDQHSLISAGSNR